MDRFIVDAQNCVCLNEDGFIYVWLDQNAQNRLIRDGAILDIGAVLNFKDDDIIFDGQVSHYEGGYLYVRTNLTSYKR
jgi:hypothetical protein